jgi:hypothetical protein
VTGIDWIYWEYITWKFLTSDLLQDIRVHRNKSGSSEQILKNYTRSSQLVSKLSLVSCFMFIKSEMS